MRNVILFLLALSPMAAFSQPAACTVEGKIGNWNAPVKVTLSYSYQGKTVHAGEAILKNGCFSFTADIDQPASASLVINYDGSSFIRDANNLLNFYIEPGTVRIESKDSLHNARPVNSPVNALGREYARQIEPSIDQIQSAGQTRRMSISAAERRDPEFVRMLNDLDDSLWGGAQSVPDRIRPHPSRIFF